MNSVMDEYLKSINVWAISSYNISSYIRKEGRHACVLDALALIMDREPCSLVRTLQYMLDTYPCSHQQISFSNGDIKEKEIGMEVEELIPFLCKIPGRDSRYRLYKYSDAILKYLDGDHFLVQYIIDAKDNEDNSILRSTKRKHEYVDYKNKISKMREFELFIHESTQFPPGYEPSGNFYYEINVAREKFYSNVQEVGDFSSINEMRKQEVDSFMYIEEAKRLKKTDELSFNQVISELGFEDDFFKRIKCYEIGGEMKQKKGHKIIQKKGRKPGYLYTTDDLDEMREIVKKVYNEYSIIN